MRKITPTSRENNFNEIPPWCKFSPTRKCNPYELKVSPPNRDLAYTWPRSRSGGEIFSDMNAFSPLGEIIIPPSIGSGHPDKHSYDIGREFSNSLTIHFHLPSLASGRHFVYRFRKFVILLNLGDIDNIGLN